MMAIPGGQGHSGLLFSMLVTLDCAMPSYLKTLNAVAFCAAMMLRCMPTWAAETVRVNADNFVRAESDSYISGLAKGNGLGKLVHRREVAPVEDQQIIRLNRDTLYSSAVFDLAASPVTLTLPDPGQRFMSMQVINEDHYTPAVFYGGGVHTLTREMVGTRYVLVGIRTLVDPANREDVEQAHALQDAIKVSQADVGSLALPIYDSASQKQVRDALLVLAAGLPDTNGMFGPKEAVDPVRHLIGAASAWGGNPREDATYLNVTPAQNDGKTVYRLRVKAVPVYAFWSISLYNAQGYYQKNAYGAYNLNNVTAHKNEDGMIDIQFGGCDGEVPNCLPVMPGWNYMVRLYRPQAQILDGSWKFPEAQPVN